MTRKERDPLAPIEFVVTVMLALTTVLFLLMFVSFVTDERPPGVPEDACLETVSAHRVPSIVSRNGVGFSRPGIEGLATDARTSVEQWRVCVDNPSAGQKASLYAARAVGLSWYVGGSLLLLLAIRAARRRGFFSHPVVRRVRVLGWFMLAATFVVPVLIGAAHGWFLSTVVDGFAWHTGLPFVGPFSFLGLFVGAGLVTFARVLERAVPLQEEVDATV